MAKVGPVAVTGAMLFDVTQPTVQVDPYVIVAMPF
jgi:hypothetical protein